MKKAGFFSRLGEEGKLLLVGPSEEMKVAYLKKSESYIVSAKLLQENGRLEESVSLAYYSMYYSLLALLFRVGIKCENHSAAIILLKEVFGVDNSEISAAEKERIDKQYYVSFSILEQEAESLIRAAEGFNATLLDVMERLNSDRISEARKRIEKLLLGTA